MYFYGQIINKVSKNSQNNFCILQGETFIREMKRLLLEDIKIALQAIKSRLLRAILTILIISIGIMALVGILTAIDSIKQSIQSNFTSMGANTFKIRNREMTVHIGRRGMSPKIYGTITYEIGRASCRERV